MPYSATQLTGFVACSHLALLDRRSRDGGPSAPQYPDPALEALIQRGLEHERAYEQAFRDAGKQVVRIPAPDARFGSNEFWERLTDDTAYAMRAGVEVIVQGGLRHGDWAGRPDFLVRVDLSDGRWTYDVIDTKLAREPKAGALLQVLLYADLVEKVHGVGPEHVAIATAGPSAATTRFRVADFAAYFRTIRAQFEQFQAQYDGTIPAAAEPVEHCGVCEWRGVCSDARREVDHLSLVAGISSRQREALRREGLDTLTQLARLPLDRRLDGITRHGLTRIREQARIQLEGHGKERPLYELLDIEPNLGLSALPEPSAGDVFLDLEANPYAFENGIEYLFGWTDAYGNYVARWALSKDDEKAAFEEFMAFVTERRREFPSMHVFHFAPYEPTALKRLMGFHGTCEAEMDTLLREGVFVDLHRVMRQSLRASVESYSIKKLEPLYAFDRSVDLRDASTALARFDALLELGQFRDEESEIRSAVEAYNRDDCISTLRLRDWLETLRGGLIAAGREVPRPVSEAKELPPEVSQRQAEIAARVEALTAGVPADRCERTPEEHACWLLAQLIDFHRREKKSFWWEYFSRRQFTEEELIEDRSTLGGLEYVGQVETVKQSIVHRYRFPVQEHGIKESIHDPATGESPGTVVAIDDAAGTIDLKRSRKSQAPHPRGLIPYDQVPDTDLRESILRTADEVIARGLQAEFSHPAIELLLANPPAIGTLRSSAPLLDRAVQSVEELRVAVLPMQGPPGAGKTYTASRMIVSALRSGRRVGVAASGHKVVCNLLKGVCEAAAAEGVGVSGIQKAKPHQGFMDRRITVVDDNAAVRTALDTGAAQLAAGTPWLWARADMAGAVDLLFIDEAGQFSLANAFAVAPAARSVVMLGDPRQLEQPQQGVHPPGADLSALDHLLAGHATIPPERGLFLDETWRLHPEICAFTSEIFYEGRLRSRPELDRQALVGSGSLAGSGLRLLAVEHEGNQSESREEVETLYRLVQELRAWYTWVDRHGLAHPLTDDDILIVAPYNAQVAALQERLPDSRIGTVDRFQGQEAPVVIYSMTTSSPHDAPRGMEFLYSPNRLNVATSRARCMAVVVASPRLFKPTCATIRQMQLANAFCRFRELATELTSAPQHQELPVHA